MIRVAAAILTMFLALALVRPASATPGYCEIEIVNNGRDKANVLVTFNDGSSSHFIIYPGERPHYVSLYYHLYCHPDAHVRVAVLPAGKVVYDALTRVGSTVHITPY